MIFQGKRRAKYYTWPKCNRKFDPEKPKNDKNNQTDKIANKNNDGQNLNSSRSPRRMVFYSTTTTINNFSNIQNKPFKNIPHQKWEVADVKDWLESFGLGIYSKIFEENSISGSELTEIVSSDLEELGITKLGLHF